MSRGLDSKINIHSHSMTIFLRSQCKFSFLCFIHNTSFYGSSDRLRVATAVFSLSSVRARDSWLTVAKVTPWPAAARMNPLLAVTCWPENIFLQVGIIIVPDVYRDHAEGVARGEDGEGPALDLARGGEAGRLVRTLVRHHLTHTRTRLTS